ncbi:HAMP domain-containing histidine kinase [bacterium]|nr:HAMP domain-containing histidine kinase [bacterium]MBU1994674.1 HAMP domain-containing histidine kinase [bacterium]
MLKIYQIFIIKFSLLLVGTLIISSFISYITIKSTMIDNNRNHLQNTILIMELNFLDIVDLDKYVLDVAGNSGLRVTIIDKDGIVIAESETDKNTMDNHGSRYEIMQANKDAFSYITRYSKTLQVDFLYVAKKSVYRGEKIYIRLSMSLGQIMHDFYDLWYKLVLASVFIVLIAFYISKKMSEKIVYDIEQITKFLDEISNKNYNAVVKTKYFYEFLQISLLLKNLVKKLSNRDKQKRKYTAKLRLMNKQRNDILSAISHEFKNPVASIMGYAQTLQEDPEIARNVREKFLGKIRSNGEKISQMLDRLALSVKLENNDLEIVPSEFDLRALSEEVIANLSSKYRNREIHFSGETVFVNADKDMMEIVINNLIDNALKYSENSVQVSIKENVFSVKDSGIGIKEDHIHKVVSKFYRVQKNTWDNSMGIGLAMVSYILKAHQSALDIASVYGKGSTFSFNIKNIVKK